MSANKTHRPLTDTGYLVLAMILIVLIILMALYGQAGIASDGSNYFAYLRSVVFDRDLDFHNEFAHFNKAFWDTYRPKETVTGHYTNVFSVGPALLWAPFYLAAHLLILTANLAGAGIRADGFGGPYYLAISLGSLFYSFLGICLVYRLCRKYFSSLASLIAVLTAWLGSFILYYSVSEPYMSHALSFFAVSLFIYLWHATRSGRTPRQWVILGLSAGLMMLVRWQNGIIMIIPAIESLNLYRTCLISGTSILRLLRNNFLFLLFAMVGFFPQMAAWKVIYGSFFTIPQGWAFMRWDAPFMMEVLFSSRHGLFAWTPLVYAAAIGWSLFFRRDRLFAFCGLATFLLMTYVNSVVIDWWAGWGFGMRRYDGFIILFAIGLAALIEGIRKMSSAAGLLTGIILFTFFTGYNLFLMNTYVGGKIHKGGPVAFDQVLGLNPSRVYRLTGYPFSFPANAIFSARYGLPPSRYDTLVGGYIDDPHFYGDTIKMAAGTVLLGTGWSPPASYNEVSSRRIEKRAILYAPIRIVTGFSMTVRAAAEPPPAAEPSANASMTVILNGKKIGTIQPDTGFKDYSLKLSKRDLRHGINIIEFISSAGNLSVDYVKFKRLEYVPGWK